MSRQFTGDTLVIASHNKGKVREIAELLGAYVAHFPSAGELNLPEPEETETTFIGNAELKARAAATHGNDLAEESYLTAMEALRTRAAEGVLAGRCPNCGGAFTARPIRPAALLAKFPASTVRVLKAEGCAAA